MIQIDFNEQLDELHRIYRDKWNENTHITVVPDRRRIVEQQVVKWIESLPQTNFTKFIKQYYSISVSNTDWGRKRSLWKSLKTRAGRKKEMSASRLAKLREKYVEVWFKYMDKTEFSLNITKAFPYVSVVAMVAPSPDWFVGISRVKLYQNGEWVPTVTKVAYAWDAGSDNGTTYLSPDKDANPKGMTKLATTKQFMKNGKLVPVGVFVFTRIPFGN